MKERPILFNGEMVRAVLGGKKSQTRRICKAVDAFGDDLRDYKGDALDCLIRNHCPYGKPGDRLWVRESFALIDSGVPDDPRKIYMADDSSKAPRWTPSIHMPRYVSRIQLEIANVRVEQVQDINEEDAEAEGVWSETLECGSGIKERCPQCWGTGLYTAHSLEGAAPDTDCQKCDTFTKRFSILWDSINANSGNGWESNPFVWVVEFKMI